MDEIFRFKDFLMILLLFLLHKLNSEIAFPKAIPTIEPTEIFTDHTTVHLNSKAWMFTGSIYDRL